MTVRLLHGDCLDRLRELPEESVHCCVTSPPYYGLRDYGVPGQIGLERTLDEYLAKMVEVFREVRRVLRSDGTLWLNIGDSYASGGRQTRDPGQSRLHPAFEGESFGAGLRPADPPGIKPKDLMMVPERLALALQADGWLVRSRIIWAKKSAMPESVRDRPTKSHEHIWLLSKSESYYYDQVAASEPCEPFPTRVPAGWATGDSPHNSIAHQTDEQHRKVKRSGNKERKDATARGCPDSGVAGSIPWEGSTRNWRDVWHLGPEPFKEAHFATFPPEIPRRAIAAGTSEKGCCQHCGAPWMREVERIDSGYDGAEYGRRAVEATGGARQGGFERSTLGSSNGALTGKLVSAGWASSCACQPTEPIPATVLDPFLGSGTTALVADRLQRDCIGIELNPEYAAMAERRIKGDAPLFAEVS